MGFYDFFPSNLKTNFKAIFLFVCTKEVLALLVPSKQRSYRIALSKQAIS